MAVDKIDPDQTRRAVAIAVAKSVIPHVAAIYQSHEWELTKMAEEHYESEIVAVAKRTLETELRALDNRELMVLLGIEPTESNADQFGVFLEALKIHEERNKRYRDVWRESGWKGALFDIKKKASRLWRQYMGEEETEGADLDDAYDLMNFAAFFVRGYQQNPDHPWGIWS